MYDMCARGFDITLVSQISHCTLDLLWRCCIFRFSIYY